MNRDAIFRETDERDPLALPSKALLRDQFRIGRVLGAGGFGITYLGYDEVLEMAVAVKEYFPQHLAVDRRDSSTVAVRGTAHADDFQFGLKRFLNEARMLAKFDDHPNIVRVRTFFEANGTGYLVMNYYDGQTLGGYLRRRHGRLDEPEALHILHNVLDGLAAVHGEGILHRDIDPSNVYLANKGRVVLLDFGAARNAIGERTQTLSVMLKRGYAPHEQYHSRGAQGPWTDVYACAATLYRTLTGYKTPEAPARIMNDELVPPQHIVPSLSDRVNKAILDGLTMHPDKRPQSIGAFQALLPERPQASVARWMDAHDDAGTAPLRLQNGADGASEVIVTAVYPCELYVNGEPSGALESPGDTLTLHLDSGRHRLRAVRTDLMPDDGSATVTSTPNNGDDTDRSHISLEALAWNTEIVASPASTTEVELTFGETNGKTDGGTNTNALHDDVTVTDSRADAEAADGDTADAEARTVTDAGTGGGAALDAAVSNAEPEPEDRTVTGPDTSTTPNAAAQSPRQQEESTPKEGTPKKKAKHGTRSEGSKSPSAPSPAPASSGAAPQESSPTEDATGSSGSALPDGDLSDALGAIASGAPDAAESPPDAPPLLTPVRAGMAVAALLVVGVLGWFLLRNQVPVATADRAVGDRSGVVVNVTANDRDPDRDAPGVGLQVASLAPVPSDVGRAVIVDSARIRFEPAPGFSGTASLQYTVSDADEGRTGGTVAVTIPFGAVPDTVATAVRDPQVLGAGDLTGNGRPDLLTTAYAGGAVIAYPQRAQGRASFGMATRLDTDALGAIDVATADLDGDGDTDVAAAIFREDAVRWYENQGAASRSDALSFAPGRALPATLPGAYAVEAADVNGDGAPDLIVASRLDGRLVWFPNRAGADATGSALFEAPRLIADKLNGLESVAVADVNGDARPDVVTATYDDDTVAWHTNQGDGTFQTAAIDTAAAGALSVHVADLDSNGAPDVLAGTADGERVVWYRHADAASGSFSAPQPIAASVRDPEVVRSGDVDADGDPDVLVASFGNGTVAWHLNDGNGRFASTLSLTDHAPEVLDARPLDLDGDGDLDVAFVSQADDTVLWYPNATQ